MQTGYSTADGIRRPEKRLRDFANMLEMELAGDHLGDPQHRGHRTDLAVLQRVGVEQHAGRREDRQCTGERLGDDGQRGRARVLHRLGRQGQRAAAQRRTAQTEPAQRRDDAR